MYQLLDTNLFVGNITDEKMNTSTEWAVVHATQTTHYKIFGWNRKNNKPSKDHPNYIYYEEGDRLSLNWVDGPAYLYKLSKPKTFIDVLDFIEKWIEYKKVCVHCDQGLSRSPSICLLYLAKRTDYISNDSFEKAKKDFLDIYPKYNPDGISDYIKQNWNKFD